VVAAIVVAVAGLTVLATLYQAVERRRRDLAVTRCLGALRREVLALVLWEAGILGAAGVLGGWLLGHGGLALATRAVRLRSGIQLDPWSTHAAEWQALGLVLVVALLAGLVPALLSYRRSPLDDLSISE
jgi:putative ABC transport system permease protein